MEYNNPTSRGNADEDVVREQYMMKVLVLGEAGVGKTSVIRRYVHNLFSQHYKTTVGVDFQWKQFTLRRPPLESGSKPRLCKVRLQLWDIAGQDRFGQIARVYYKDASGALLVYDANKPATLKRTKTWKDQIDEKVVLANNEPIPVVLCGNKCDLPVNVEKEDYSKVVKDCGFVDHFFTSARKNIDIDKAARRLVEQILENEEKFGLQNAQRANQQKAGAGFGVNLDDDADDERYHQGKEKGGSCC
eukprot:g37.t1